MTPPRATARLQLHAGFTLDDARAQVDYYASLGISHLYLSPIFTARPGSTHGYDIVDFSSINPELGGEAALRALSQTLHQHEMGLIIDIVPNHMGVDLANNQWWRDVMRHGKKSPYATTFDIDWAAPHHDGKLLLPILGESLGAIIENRELSLNFDEPSGRFELAYADHRLPLSPESEAALTEAAGRSSIEAVLAEHATDTTDGAARLMQLHEQQHYRLAWWRTAADEINWRRFFEISDLAGLRIERDDVLEATHALTFSLYRQGIIDGVRVDHVDGLADPAAYCVALRNRLETIHPHRPGMGHDEHPYIVVEKILADDEPLPSDWPVDGTTGYDFMNDVIRVLHDPAGETSLDALWNLSVGRNDDFETEQKQARRQVLNENLVSEFQSLVRRLHALALTDPLTRDTTAAMIERALGALLENFPVYRTYVSQPGVLSRQDRAVFDRALEGARVTLRNADHGALPMIENWLGASAMPAEHLSQQIAAIVKFQQLTSPLAAKAVEDTAFYRYHRLLSLNEVGGDPGVFSLSVDDFHQRLRDAAQHLPNRMLATATHDHKRGEDLRARLAVLSEVAPKWAEAVAEWRADAHAWRSSQGVSTAPSASDELAALQMIVGAWPMTLSADDDEGVHELLERLAAWQLKAVREAKLQSNWVAPDEDYEAACKAFLFSLRDVPSGDSNLLERIAKFAQSICAAGAINSLAQLLIRATSPGVPDLYQGTEFWDLSLVDPDNRRPVDMLARREALEKWTSPEELMANWHDGRIKQAVLRDALACRTEQATLFAKGDYIPLRTLGEHRDRLLAYVRQHEGRSALVVVTRLSMPLIDGTQPHVAPQNWGDTRIVLDESLGVMEWGDELSGQNFHASPDGLKASELLKQLPVALLIDRHHHADHEGQISEPAAQDLAPTTQTA